jgi:hypothetical protein
MSFKGFRGSVKSSEVIGERLTALAYISLMMKPTGYLRMGS